jgi:hypothetical protein
MTWTPVPTNLMAHSNETDNSSSGTNPILIENGTLNNSTPKNPPTSQPDPFSLDKLTDFFQDLEGDKTPTDSSVSFVPAAIIPMAASSYRHQFVIYKKQWIRTSDKPNSQLSLLGLSLPA